MFKKNLRFFRDCTIIQILYETDEFNYSYSFFHNYGQSQQRRQIRSLLNKSLPQSYATVKTASSKPVLRLKFELEYGHQTRVSPTFCSKYLGAFKLTSNHIARKICRLQICDISKAVFTWDRSEILLRSQISVRSEISVPLLVPLICLFT